MSSIASQVRANASSEAVAHDHIVVLDGVTWADYQRHLEMRGERPVPRFTYLEGRLELMAPSRPHEQIKSMIGRLVEVWCLEKEIDISPFGSWTLEDEAAERGAEPDECYVLGEEREPERPDLAIEVVWTSGGLRKLDVYAGLRVREVWIWHRGRLSVYELSGERYVERETSACLPGLDLAQLAGSIAVYPMTRAVRAYRAALRDARG